MPHSTLDFRVRAQLIERMDEPCSRDVLRPYLRSLARTNRWTFGYRPTIEWLDSMKGAMARSGRPIRILDVGCGYGDGLRQVERWARVRKLSVELTGLDVSADATAIAAEASPPASRIRWINADVFGFRPVKPPDLIVSALFTHHLDDGEIVRFLEWMEQNANLGWYINDLSRAAIPYHFFRVFSRAFLFHPNVQHDGPISIARSFVAEDWRRLCAAAGLEEPAIEIRGHRPARLCVARSKAR